MRWQFAVLAALSAAQAGYVQASAAEAVTLQGHATQGGLMRGQAEPGSRVIFDGREVRLDQRGRFVVGFGRDAGPRAALTVISPRGEQEMRVIAVAPRVFDIQHIEGLPPAMVTPDPALSERIARENEKIALARKTDSDEGGVWSAFVRPADGPISGVYGSQRILNGVPRQPHYGLDIAGVRGAPVRAPASGVVILAEPDLYYTGATLMIDHGFGLSSVLMHLEDYSVKAGDRVEAGQVIARLGATGRATGPHLDWRVNWFAVRIDPALLLEPESPSH